MNRQEPTQYMTKTNKTDMSFDNNALSLGSRSVSTTQAAEESKGVVADGSTLPTEKQDVL